MKLSIVIVNYNVKYFLEQCLYSVYAAVKNLSIEVFVVDNNSVDGSCAMVREKFPEVILIENSDNVGFSKANNQAIRISKGEYVLLLNPDTLVEEDTFIKIVDFMNQHPDAGGLGVKMIDGKGDYLPESKRGFPTPWVAFFKTFGLTNIFPRSKRFARYYLGHLSENEINEVEILAGAFMLLRKSVLDEIGLLDETYFMYGEDIDLSYRILLGGYKNYYFPKTTIIHYKGESTKKGSINYVLVFYNAMLIFARKHLSKSTARLFTMLIKVAIYFRAFLSILKRFFDSAFLPIADALIIFVGILIFKPYYETIKFEEGVFPPEFLYYIVPSYILIWTASTFFLGGHEKPIKISKSLKGTLVGTGIILIIYALLSESYRFSRAVILFGAVWTMIFQSLLRYGLHLLKFEAYQIHFDLKKRIVIIGKKVEIQRVEKILKKTHLKYETVGYVSPNSKNMSNYYIGKVNQLKEIVKVNKIDEIIFCSKDMPSQKIIKLMLRLANLQIEFKIAPPESLSVIGSNSINTTGDLYYVNINTISKASNVRNKRLIDIGISFLLLLISPVLIFFYQSRIIFLKNCFNIFRGKYSFVGYCYEPETRVYNLPKLKPGVLNPTDVYTNKQLEKESISNLNTIYAKNYRVATDLLILFKGFKRLNRNVKTV